MYRTTFDGSRQSDVVSPVLTCLSKNGDNVGVGRQVDMGTRGGERKANKKYLSKEYKRTVRDQWIVLPLAITLKVSLDNRSLKNSSFRNCE